MYQLQEMGFGAKWVNPNVQAATDSVCTPKGIQCYHVGVVMTKNATNMRRVKN